jgi:hypothetical protein
MSDIGNLKYHILILLLCISSFAIANMIYRYQKGRAYRELKKVHKPSEFTVYLLNEYKHFFEPRWWDWGFVALFCAVLGIIIIDTY